MAFGGDVDTLSLTFDKLQYIFRGYDQIRDVFLEINSTYKQGKISNIEFFDKVQEGVLRFSALEFLAIKSIFEIKKSIYRNSSMSKDDTAVSEISSPNHSVSSFIVAGILPTPNNHITSKKQEVRNCSKCTMPVKPNVNFCTNCGMKA